MNNILNNKRIGGILSFIVLLIFLFITRNNDTGSTETANNTVEPQALVEIDPTATVASTSEPQQVATEVAIEVATETAVSSPTTNPTTPLWANSDGDFDYYTLALSWQPAFCETNGRKPECASQTSSRYDATNFVLHGLWPNRHDDPTYDFAYCEQSDSIIERDNRDWCELPPLSLSDTIASDLQVFMPGSVSCLQNHEWYKHGTCAGMSDDAYFALSNALVQQFSQTAFTQYVADHIGEEVSRRDLLNVFEDEFGTDEYLSLRCTDIDGVSTLSEIRLPLKQDLNDVSNFSDIFPSEYIRPQGNCPSYFVIDAAG
jgi:ribonuclease T2